MTQGLHISKFTNNDIEELVQLVNSAYRGEGSKKGWTTEADLLDGIRTDTKTIELIANKPGAVILVATNEAGRIAGCVYLQQHETQLYLGMLAVSPEIQSRGIGKQLLHAAENYAIEMNCTVITMTVINVRVELIEWYKRHGYHATGETMPFPTSPSFGIPKQPLQFIVLKKNTDDIKYSD